MTAHDPLHLPLSGIRTVEANAGTGKTFTIALLYLRLILETGLAVDEIVVATFTRAATAELCERLRDWLALAARQLADADPGRVREGESGAAPVIRAILRQAHARSTAAGDTEAWTTLRGRADAARLASDTAQVSTLHAFCFRVLNEFGFETGSPLRQPELIEDLRALDLEIIRDFWRRHGGGDATAAALLEAAWGGPEALARQVSEPRWEGRVIDLPPAADDADADAAAGHAKAALLCEARTFLVDQRARRLAARNRMSHDGAVQALRAALAGAHAQQALQQIRRRWKAALVDEFQDTDEAQWDVVRHLFGASTLILVGDPKQAIYGFRGGDVHAWRKATAAAEPPPLHLTTSYRAGARLCDAVNGLFGVDAAFNDAAIGYHAVAASAASAGWAVEHAGHSLPGLAFWSFTARELGQPDAKPVAKDRARDALEQRCVAYLAALLQDATLRDGDGNCKPLTPRDVAVLVNSNREADAMQAALARAGIPAVSNLAASVYASEEAADLALLLAALADPANADRARAAWASRLAGQRADAIAASLTGSEAGPQLDVARWAGEVRHQGVLAWLHGLLADAAPRLLQRPDGARRVSNYLQLAELLQADQAAGFGLADLANRFARARADAGDGDAASDRLRLETDADAVTVSTVHAAKGLEYAVVLLPYAGFGRAPDRRGKQSALAWYHDADGNARVAVGAAPDAVQAHAQDETLAEDLRKLYVAITRAKALCVLPWGRINQSGHGALHHLLQRAGRDEALAFDDAGCRAALDALQARATADAIGIVAWNDIPQAARYVPAAPAAAALRAAQFEHSGLEHDWTVWSFSRLVRGSHNQAAEPAPGASDDDDDADDGAALGGARFGSAVHAVFERADFTVWRDAEGVPDAERALIERELAAQGLPGGALALPHAVDFVGSLVTAALNTVLACGTRIADLPAGAHRAEIEFHLSLAPADSTRLYELLHRFGYQMQREDIAPARLAGLLTGKIDLTFRHAGKYYLVDWKTNRCPPYDDAALTAEIARHDYDLQWLVYTLALHRWLRAVLPDYAYARDFGGAYYLFVRGMRNGKGVHFDRPDERLIDALDALLGASRREAA